MTKKKSKIKEMRETMSWLFLGFIVGISGLVLFESVITGILSVILWAMIMNLNTAIRFEQQEAAAKDRHQEIIFLIQKKNV